MKSGRPVPARGGVEGGHAVPLDAERFRHGQPGIPQQPLGDVLVDGGDRSEQPAACERHTGTMPALDRTILARHSMQHGKENVDRGHFIGCAPWGMASMRPWPPGTRLTSTASSTGRRRRRRTLGRSSQRPSLGHEDRQHVVAVGVEGRDDVGGRQEGDVVFGERPPNRMAMRGRESLGRWLNLSSWSMVPFSLQAPHEQSDCFAAEFRADHEIASCGRIYRWRDKVAECAHESPRDMPVARASISRLNRFGPVRRHRGSACTSARTAGADLLRPTLPQVACRRGCGFRVRR